MYLFFWLFFNFVSKLVNFKCTYFFFETTSMVDIFRFNNFVVFTSLHKTFYLE